MNMHSSSPYKRTRPVFKIAAIDDQEKFRPLPPPTGAYPLRLDIKQVLPDLNTHKLNFQMCGDTGGLTGDEYNHKVATAMISQFNKIDDNDKPDFFFHLGDLVYNFGQQAKYYTQFFSAYRDYPAPIFAIAGNHDADVDPLDAEQPATLKAFLKVFCDSQPQRVPFAGDTDFKSNIQPHVYYTLQTPLADFICLYSNVPKFGTIDAGQRAWFINELINANKNNGAKALIICLHHSAYSADINHGSSLPMQNFLNSAFEETNIYPDIVFSGHVHNYQRFNKTYANGKVIPFIVSGAGGYAMLHPIAPANDPAFPDTSSLLDDVVLEQYCDDNYGFLKISIEKKEACLTLSAAYYTVTDSGEKNSHPQLFDSFRIEMPYISY